MDLSLYFFPYLKSLLATYIFVKLFLPNITYHQMAIFSLILYTVIFSFLLHSILTLFFRKRYPLPLPPGPKPWPIIGNLVHMGPKPHQSIAAMARTYGPLMHLKMGFVDVVVAASASVAAQFLKTHDANFSSRPQNSCTKHLAYNSQDLVFAPYGPRWRMLRKICSVHLFSAKALDDFSHVRQVFYFTFTTPMFYSIIVLSPYEFSKL